jgi:hypothetical protein
MNVRLLAGLERQAAVRTGTGTNVSMDARRLVIVGTSKTSNDQTPAPKVLDATAHLCRRGVRSYRNKIHLDNSALEPQSLSKIRRRK